MHLVRRKRNVAFLGALALAAGTAPALGAESGPATARMAPTYADLADLADSARLVLRAQVRDIARVENERAPGLRPGHGRFFVRARTRALLTGNVALGESLRYLVDVPLDERGKPPRIKKREVLLFARPVPGNPDELQLVAPGAQLLWDEALESRLRSILTELVAADAPARVTGVREMIYVPGNLAGAGETQIFLSTADNSAASITVRHQPGAPPQWGASFSELLADVGSPPPRDTLAWYRLACFLPDAPPRGVNHSETAAGKAQAEADYRMVLGALGACPRSRR